VNNDDRELGEKPGSDWEENNKEVEDPNQSEMRSLNPTVERDSWQSFVRLVSELRARPCDVDTSRI
jgi:hypothetical protein